MAEKDRERARQRRHQRVRAKVKGTGERPRLAVFRSDRHMYAQLIDDARGHTLAAASTLEPGLKWELAGLNKTAQASLVGKVLAERAQLKGIKQVVFDRGGHAYHGRVRALADASRQSGLEF